MVMQPILRVTVFIKKIKGAARQRNVVTVGVDEPLAGAGSQRFVHQPFLAKKLKKFSSVRS